MQTSYDLLVRTKSTYLKLQTALDQLLAVGLLKPTNTVITLVSAPADNPQGRKTL